MGTKSGNPDVTLTKSGDPVNESAMSKTGFALQLIITDVTTVKMAKFWPQSASAWVAILEAQFRLH